MHFSSSTNALSFFDPGTFFMVIAPKKQRSTHFLQPAQESVSTLAR
jgi:hypothetical protein